jgi:hypothetical protein
VNNIKARRTKIHGSIMFSSEDSKHIYLNYLNNQIKVDQELYRFYTSKGDRKKTQEKILIYNSR